MESPCPGISGIFRIPISSAPHTARATRSTGSISTTPCGEPYVVIPVTAVVDDDGLVRIEGDDLSLVPAIDSTKVVGLISLPGADDRTDPGRREPADGHPLPDRGDVYMLLAATALAALTAARLAERAMFDDAQRLVPIPQPSEPP